MVCFARALGRTAVLLSLVFTAAYGQSSWIVFIDTIAGAAKFDQLPARQTPLIEPQAVWVHPNGDLYIADGNFLVRRVRGGVSTIVAGGGDVVDDSVPVPGTKARLDYPAGLAGTEAGDLYISDVRHHRVRRLNADGSIVTVVGTGTAGYAGDGGRATFAELDSPTALALGPAGQLYIADTFNNVIRRYDPRTGLITTVAGTGEEGYSGDNGPALNAQLGLIRGLAFDPAGNLFLSDVSNYVVRKIAPDGTITTFAGNGKYGYSDEGVPATSTSLTESRGLATDAAGNLYIADYNANRIRRVTPDGIISTYAGQSTTLNPGAENIPATDASLAEPTGIWVDVNGNLFIPEGAGDLVRRVDASTKIITTVAGTLDPFDGIKGDSAPLIRPTDVAADTLGNLYVADNGHYRVRKIDRASGLISTVAGDGHQAGSVGATNNSLGGGVSISIDPTGGLLIADADEQVVRRVELATGKMSTIIDLSYDESRPAAAVADQAGYVYVSDRHYNQIYVFPPTADDGTVLAGTGEEGLEGDGGLAKDAKLNRPEGMVLDGHEGLLFCDYGNHVVRRIDLVTGIITRFAGDGIDDTNYDGHPAVEASLQGPIALAKDGNGWIFIADADGDVIRAVDSDGYIYNVAGSGDPGFAGDGQPASLALFDGPLGLAFFRNSNDDEELYVCDSENYRIRRLFVKQVEKKLEIAPAGFTFHAAQNATAAAGEAGGQVMILQSSIVGLNLSWHLSAPGFDGNWLFASYLDGETPDAILVWVQPDGLAPGTYNATMVLSSKDGAADVKVPIELIVDPPNVASAVTLSSAVLEFTVPRDGSETQTLAVSSAGANALNWQVQWLTDNPWLRLSANSGTTPATVSVTASAAGLEAGTYFAVAYITSGSGVTLFVASMVVSPPKASMQLDRDILIFEAVEGSTSSLPQTINIYNPGSDDLKWELVPPADAVWVRPSLFAGTVAPGGRPAPAGISVDPSGLRAGVYNAALTLRATGALGSPQIVSVRLKVAPGDTRAKAVFDKSALVFRGAPGEAIPEQTIDIGSTGGELRFSTSVKTENGKSWLSVTPANGTVVSSSDKQALRFQVNARDLPEGVHNATVDYSFSDGSLRQSPVVLILRAGATRSNEIGMVQRSRAAACAPSRLVMITPTLPNSFAVSVGWPVLLQVQVFDDCGAPSADGMVTVLFSNNDAAKTLTNLKNGQYTGTWTPSSAAGSVTVRMQARHPVLPSVESKLSGSLAADEAPPPLLFAGGVLNAASRRTASLVAPGTQLALTGAYFPDNPDDVTVLVNGSKARVLSSSAGEIRILAPDTFDGQTRAAVIVSARGLSTPPETVTVVAADPGLFLPDDQAAPVGPGDTLTVTATGLGAVDGDGNVALKVTAKLGDLDAPVKSAVLPKDAAGVYQVQVTIPDGATGAMQLTLKQNGVTSNAIPVSLK